MIRLPNARRTVVAFASHLDGPGVVTPSPSVPGRLTHAAYPFRLESGIRPVPWAEMATVGDKCDGRLPAGLAPEAHVERAFFGLRGPVVTHDVSVQPVLDVPAKDPLPRVVPFGEPPDHQVVEVRGEQVGGEPRRHRPCPARCDRARNGPAGSGGPTSCFHSTDIEGSSCRASVPASPAPVSRHRGAGLVGASSGATGEGEVAQP